MVTLVFFTTVFLAMVAASVWRFRGRARWIMLAVCPLVWAAGLFVVRADGGWGGIVDLFVQALFAIYYPVLLFCGAIRLVVRYRRGRG
jgi:hypothetical protein